MALGPPHLTLNPPKKRKNKKNYQKNTKKKKEGGLRAKWGGPSGHLTWPLNPPKKTQKQKKKKRNKRKNKKTRKKRSPKRKQQKYPKISFSIISQIFPFFGVAFQNFPFLTPWPKKRAPKKHYKNRGFKPFFLKSSCASRNGHFWTKKKQNS